VRDLTLKQAALQLGFVDEATFDQVVDPTKMVRPHVASATKGSGSHPTVRSKAPHKEIPDGDHAAQHAVPLRGRAASPT
jgi:hypothetical protein